MISRLWCFAAPMHRAPGDTTASGHFQSTFGLCFLATDESNFKSIFLFWGFQSPKPTIKSNQTWNSKKTTSTVSSSINNSNNSINSINSIKTTRLAKFSIELEAQRLLEEGADPHLPDGTGDTPLHVACRLGPSAEFEKMSIRCWLRLKKVGWNMLKDLSSWGEASFIQQLLVPLPEVSLALPLPLCDTVFSPMFWHPPPCSLPDIGPSVVRLERTTRCGTSRSETFGASLQQNWRPVHPNGFNGIWGSALA